MSVTTDEKKPFKKLVILDVNGLLGYKCGKDEIFDDSLPRQKLEFYDFIERPGVKPFIDKLLEKYQIAIFTSATFYNYEGIIKKLLTPEQVKSMTFRWYRDKTRHDREANILGLEKYSTVKVLQDLFDNPVYNRDDEFNSTNTILCDDCPIKTRHNPPENVIIVEGFKGDPQDTYLEDLPDLIDQRFLELSSN